MSAETVQLVQFEKHEPERGRAGRARLFCCGGCCCCCCCLDALGGLVGATVATCMKKPLTGGSVVGCYWIILALLSAGAIVIVAPACSDAGTLGMVPALLALLFLPVLQLAASILTAVWIASRSAGVLDKKAGLRVLGNITLWSLLGAATGLGAMAVLFPMSH